MQRTPVKKVKTSDAVAESSSTNERGEPYWQLDDKKRVSVASFQGKTRVDIREFYSKDGKLLPGKKGIGLQPAQWRKLLEIAEEVTKALDAQ